MKVAIDIRRIEDFGVGTYIRNLVHALIRQDRENEYVLLGESGQSTRLPHSPSNFRFMPLGKGRPAWRTELELHRLIQANDIHLLHIPYLRPALLIPCRYLLTVHDLAEFLYPRETGWKQNLRFRMVKRTLERAQRIIAVSRATQRDIENLFGIGPDRVRVVGNALDERFVMNTRREESNLVLQRYGVVDPFLLYAGSARPQKNLPRLIEAFAVAKGELREHPRYKNLKLLIIGDELSEHPDLRSCVIRTRMQKDVRFFGFVPVEILRVFYAAAEVFVFPSLHEGFGLPPLEAMALGTPVVTSNVSSLPEVVGDAAVLVHPENVFDIARGMERALLDEALRMDLKARGKKQVAKFSWERSVKQVLEIYGETVA